MAGDPLDELFAAPLGEFVAVRNRIASELRKSGDKDAADEVKAIKKPSAVVWTLNGLAREDKAGVKALVDAADRMREVQSGRSNTSFADAQKALTGATRKLAKRGAELLAEGDKKPSDAMAQRLDRALTAAAASPEVGELLRAGRLLEEPEPVGFGGIGDVVATPASSRAKAAKQPTARERRAAEREAERRERLEEAQRELREAKGEAAKLSREAERAQERVVALEQKVAALRPDERRSR
jgi:hypothetical protein